MVIGALSAKFNVKTLILVLLIGAVGMVSYFGQGHSDLAGLALTAAIAGFFTNGVIVGLYALFAQIFDTNVRATGTGFVIGSGRGGSALGPVIAGFMFTLSFGLDSVAIIMALGSAVAFIAILSLRVNTPFKTPAPH